MLIPVTHPTQCVAECAKCGFSGQANTTWGPSTEFSGPSPDSIWPSEFHRSIRTHNTLANHRTHNTRPHCHFDWRMGIGCAMAAERWVWANEKPYFSYVEIHVLTRGIRTQTNFTRNDQQKTAACKGAYHERVGFKYHVSLCRDESKSHQ